MIVQVTKDVRIRAEDENHTIEKCTIVQTGVHKGEERWLPIGYYGRLVDALVALLDRYSYLLVDSITGVSSAKLNVKLGQVVDAINEAKAAIIAAVKEAE